MCVCDVFEIYYNNIVIIAHYKRMGFVIIPKLNVSSREGINSHCRRVDLLLFTVLASSVSVDSICRRLGHRRFDVLLAIN